MVELLEPVPIKDIWQHEAYDFTTWLFSNIEVLGDHINVELYPLEQAKSVGPFYIDILAKDGTGRQVIIENQFMKSYHDHLGKVLTYLSNTEAKIAIWICENPRPEHVTAITFLNEMMPNDVQFYLVKLQAFRIGESEPAPLFTVEAGPAPETAARGQLKKELAESEKRRYDFFEQLLEKSNQRIPLFQNVSPQYYQNWVGTGAGKSGLSWMYVVMKDKARAELFFQHSDEKINEERFHTLLEYKDKIEEQFGDRLDWDYKESRKQQYIRSWVTIGGIEDEDRWDELQNTMVDWMFKMEKTFKDYIQNLKR